MISTAFVIAALILAILAAINVTAPRVALGWSALACYFASLLVSRLMS
jgi:hypothetical protein